MPFASMERRRAYGLAWHQAHKYRKHGLTNDEVHAIILRQCGECPCGDLLGARPEIDHDHQCCPGFGSCGNCVRGAVHSSCNKVMGFAHDNPRVLRNLATYLETAE